MTDTAAPPDAADAPDAPDGPGAPATRYGLVVGDSRGQLVLHATVESYLPAMRALDDDGFTVCADLTAVDYLEAPHRALPPGVVAERFEVVVNVLDMAVPRRARVRVQVPASAPEVPSLFDLYPGTEAMEREVYDMFGIAFGGHPDLTRILMPEDWEGHPLRKDYDLGAIPVRFKATGDR